MNVGGILSLYHEQNGHSEFHNYNAICNFSVALISKSPPLHFHKNMFVGFAQFRKSYMNICHWITPTITWNARGLARCTTKDSSCNGFQVAFVLVRGECFFFPTCHGTQSERGNGLLTEKWKNVSWNIYRAFSHCSIDHSEPHGANHIPSRSLT